MIYPRECPGCGLVREENDFSRDRYQPSGRKSRCKACCNRAVQTCHHDVRKPRSEAALEAERRAEEKIRQRAHTGSVSRLCARKPTRAASGRRSSFARSRRKLRREKPDAAPIDDDRP
jgi:hypothetical protein